MQKLEPRMLSRPTIHNKITPSPSLEEDKNDSKNHFYNIRLVDVDKIRSFDFIKTMCI